MQACPDVTVLRSQTVCQGQNRTSSGRLSHRGDLFQNGGCQLSRQQLRPILVPRSLAGLLDRGAQVDLIGAVAGIGTGTALQEALEGKCSYTCGRDFSQNRSSQLG